MAAPASRSSSAHRKSSLSPERMRSEEHTSELQSQSNLVCRLLLEKKKSACRPQIPCRRYGRWRRGRFDRPQQWLALPGEVASCAGSQRVRTSRALSFLSLFLSAYWQASHSGLSMEHATAPDKSGAVNVDGTTIDAAADSTGAAATPLSLPSGHRSG